MNSGISKYALKQRNRTQILRIIQAHAPISRADIADMLGLTRAAVTVLVNQMLDQHILVELGDMAPPEDAVTQRGRRKIMLTYNENYRFALGIYIDAHGVGMGLSTLGLRILEKQWFPCQALQSADEVLSFIQRTYQTFLSRSGIDPGLLLGAGVGIMPAMFQVMGCTQYSDGSCDCSALCAQLEQRLGIPAAGDNAIVLAATTGSYIDGHPEFTSRRLVLSHDGDDHYLIAYPLGADGMVRRVDALCVVPDGREMADYPEGSVQAELSGQALRDQLAQLAPPETAPALWEMLHQRPLHQTLATLLAASREMPMLADFADQVAGKLVLMLHNLSILLRPQRISLFHLGLSLEDLEQIRTMAIRLVGITLAARIEADPLEPWQYFLWGCAHIIQRDFFDVGGVLPQ